MRKNFTLVELVIVIAILMVLISLLSPSLNKLRHATVTLNCVKQMRTLSLALNYYLDDNNHFYWAEATMKSNLRQWHEGLFNKKIVNKKRDSVNLYIENRNLLRCNMGRPDYFHRYKTYGFLTNIKQPNMNFNEFSSPDSQFILGDSMSRNGQQFFRVRFRYFHKYEGGLSFRHNQGNNANILHLDGHVLPYSTYDMKGLYFWNTPSLKSTFVSAAIYSEKGEVLPFRLMSN